MTLAELMDARGIEDRNLYDSPTGGIVADESGPDDPEDYDVLSNVSRGSTHYAIVRGPSGDLDGCVIQDGEVRLHRDAIERSGNGLLHDLEMWSGSL